MSVNVKEATQIMLDLGVMPFTLTAEEERAVVYEAADLVVSSLGTENLVSYTKHFLSFSSTVQSENFELTVDRIAHIFLVKGMADFMFTLPEWKEWAKVAWTKESKAVTC